MRKTLLFISLFSICNAWSQIDYSKLIIGRNMGTHTFHDGLQTRIFGFTETLSAATKIPGPTIYLNSGDSVKLDFWNMSQGAPHTIHLHGLDVNQQNDGVGMLSFEVMHNEHGFYYFKAPHPGTYLYHCHVGSTIHLQAGMYGLIVVRPADGNPLLNWENGESYDREFPLLASEIDTVWHNDTILDQEHDMMLPLYVPATFNPNYFLINGKSGTQLSAIPNHLLALPNEKIYMRLANIGYYGVRFIFPAILEARTAASDGRPLPVEVVNDTIEVLPGERYETFLQLGTENSYPFIVEHFNLNTQAVSSSQTMVIETTFSDVEANTKVAFEIFPNPTNGIFEISEMVTENYQIYSLEGKKLKESMESPVSISDFANGSYLLHYKGNTLFLVKD